MSTTRILKATVRAGGMVEVTDPDLPVGETVEVTVRLSNENKSARQSVLDILNASEGGVLFKSVEDVDSYIRQERELWDR